MNKLKRIIAAISDYRSPRVILLACGLSIFFVETLIMLALLLLSPQIPTLHALLDAFVLVALLSPLLYFLLFKPLIRLVRERDDAIGRLTEAHNRAQKYLDVAGVIIVVLDREGRVSLINKKGCEILGYHEGEIVGKDWFDNFLPRRTGDEVRGVFKDITEGKMDAASGHYENPLLTKSGDERVILWYNTILREGGRVVGTLSSGEDTTDRKRTEKALKESEIKYRQIHSTAFDAILIADRHDRLVECNPSARKMFGYETGDMVGMNIRELMPEKYRERHTSKVHHFLKTGVSTSMNRVLEMEGLKKDGTIFPIEIVLNTFIIAGERYFTGMIRDITERKRSEEEKDLIQTRLNQSQKMEAIGRFSGGIAHDFNNILSAIRGNAELALEDMKKDDPAYERLDGIILSVMLAAKLTRQLLLFSRSQPFELVPIDINKTIEDLLVMKTRLQGKDISIKTELSPDVWIIEADEGTIEQVVMNLALNAKDAMPDGGTLNIRTRNVTVAEEDCKSIPEAHPGNVVCLTVSDSGAGMGKETLQRIFEPLFTTKEAGKGTGFGLSVVYSIVKQHGGWITVRSAPRKGTTFNLYMPALIGKQARATVAMAGKRGLGEHILLVDSEKNMLKFAQVSLSEHGYTVHVAQSAGEAVEIFKSHKDDLHILVSDVLLPDQSGITLAERLRAKKKPLGVVIMSGYADERAKPEVLAHKFKYLRKPFSLNSLLTAVKEAAEDAEKKS